MTIDLKEALSLADRYRAAFLGVLARLDALQAELSRRGIAVCAACNGKGVTVCTDLGCGKEQLHVCDLRSCAPCRGTGLAL